MSLATSKELNFTGIICANSDSYDSLYYAGIIFLRFIVLPFVHIFDQIFDISPELIFANSYFWFHGKEFSRFWPICEN